MARLTYQDKISLKNPQAPEQNLGRAADWNAVKASTNHLYDLIYAAHVAIVDPVTGTETGAFGEAPFQTIQQAVNAAASVEGKVLIVAKHQWEPYDETVTISDRTATTYLVLEHDAALHTLEVFNSDVRVCGQLRNYYHEGGYGELLSAQADLWYVTLVNSTCVFRGHVYVDEECFLTGAGALFMNGYEGAWVNCYQGAWVECTGTLAADLNLQNSNAYLHDVLDEVTVEYGSYLSASFVGTRVTARNSSFYLKQGTGAVECYGSYGEVGQVMGNIYADDASVLRCGAVQGNADLWGGSEVDVLGGIAGNASVNDGSELTVAGGLGQLTIANSAATVRDTVSTLVADTSTVQVGGNVGGAAMSMAGSTLKVAGTLACDTLQLNDGCELVAGQLRTGLLNLYQSSVEAYSGNVGTIYFFSTGGKAVLRNAVLDGSVFTFEGITPELNALNCSLAPGSTIYPGISLTASTPITK